MPSNYTGQPSNAAEAVPTISVPVDTDPLNAASAAGPMQHLADWLAKFQASIASLASSLAALLGANNSWTGANTWSGTHNVTGAAEFDGVVTFAGSIQGSALIHESPRAIGASGNAAFQNGFSSGSEGGVRRSLSYCLNREGDMLLTGMVICPAFASVGAVKIAQLPYPYQPAKQTLIPCMFSLNSADLTYIDFEPDGSLNLAVTAQPAGGFVHVNAVIPLMP